MGTATLRHSCPRLYAKSQALRSLIAVGTPVARCPPHRPGRAGLPHPVPTLSLGVEASLLRCLTHPPEGIWHALPALCPARGTPGWVPLGCRPSLHQVRSRFSSRLCSLVPRLRRYYDGIRLLVVVHLGITALAFPSRPAPASSGDHEISRFSRAELVVCMPSFSDPARPFGLSRYRVRRCCLPQGSTTSASGSAVFGAQSRRPAHPLLTLRLRLTTTPHSSGSRWFATPFLV